MPGLPRVWWIAAVAPLAAGCFLDIDFEGTSFLCETEPTCPAGYSCVAGRCVEGGAADGGTIDENPDGGGGPAAELRFRRQLTFDNGGRGALDGFPLLVQLDPERIEYDAVRADGGDIQFRDADGTTLPHEIETWNPGGTSVLWVHVPRIDEGSTTDHIFMHYGNPEATVAENEEAVWTAYRAVYHLNQAGGAEVDDSTAQGFDGEAIGATLGEGRVGQAYAFNGTDQYIDLGAGLAIASGLPAVTAEAWLAPGTLLTPGIALGVSINGDTDSRIQMRVTVERVVEAGGRTQDGGQIIDLAGGALPVDEWTWVVMVLDFAGDRITVYRNGAEAATAERLFDPATPDTTSDVAVIGVDENKTQNFWLGRIDEVRVAGEVKSADWVSAQYEAMTERLVSFGPAEEP